MSSLLERESRLTEMLIGELLGPAVTGRPSNGDGKLTTCEDLSRIEAHRFRALADNTELGA
jgi:hypothetical protein